MSGSAGTSSAPSAPSSLSMVQHPLNTVTSAVRHAPGATAVKGVVEGVLDTVGAVSPQARRVAAYAGSGLLGVVEWPVAAVGAAVEWLTQARRRNTDGAPARPAARTSAAGQAEPGQRPAAERAAEPAAKPTAKKAAKQAVARTPRSTAKATARPRRTGSAASGQSA
ncbi:hypothetical protein [Streptacidiphilus sp. P02-A3a]|uniref:hypothetical protein n=1 Tax=Streptacidiphilus sp. P02-A3a TaxID=2704468 RepID=UPI0015F993DE|nr:hypothetical protein [Streptacidiphilus sp. P02-A3a]QMU70667.1 hypothetical protein GXP74_23135 [Streptacidiphilus sp. P02-A3a]